MKNWDYYESDVNYESKMSIRRRLMRELTLDGLNEDDRHDAILQAEEMAIKLAIESAAAHEKDQQRLDAEFWKDCRESIGYDSILTEKGCLALETHAKLLSHSEEFQDMYDVLVKIYKLVCDTRPEFLNQ